MSGGNQQKTIIAREIDKNYSLLIAVQSTRELDVGAIEYIHKQIVADRGAAVLLVSYELEKLFGLADRILVMYEGQITGELNPKKTSREEAGLYMSGAKRNTLVKTVPLVLCALSVLFAYKSGLFINIGAQPLLHWNRGSALVRAMLASSMGSVRSVHRRKVLSTCGTTIRKQPILSRH